MISLTRVNKYYGENHVVRDLSLEVKNGKTFGFLGQNGAGKTTVMKMIVGISVPDSGTITLGGGSSRDIQTRERIGYMPEAPYFYERLTGFEFLTFCGRLFCARTGDNRETHEDILKKVGMYEARNQIIRTYSKGMKQRLGFAQALVNNPDYVFLDEPLDGLDPVGRKEIKAMIKTLRAAGKTVFFNSHILYDTEELCDEIGIIHRGELLYSGPVRNFTNGRPLEERFVEMIEEINSKNL